MLRDYIWLGKFKISENFVFGKNRNKVLKLRISFFVFLNKKEVLSQHEVFFSDLLEKKKAKFTVVQNSCFKSVIYEFLVKFIN